MRSNLKDPETGDRLLEILRDKSSLIRVISFWLEVTSGGLPSNLLTFGPSEPSFPPSMQALLLQPLLKGQVLQPLASLVAVGLAHCS